MAWGGIRVVGKSWEASPPGPILTAVQCSDVTMHERVRASCSVAEALCFQDLVATSETVLSKVLRQVPEW